MKSSNLALNLTPSLIEEARLAAEAEGVGLDQFVSAAISAKLSAMRPDAYFRERAGRASLDKAREILRRSGVGNPPEEGDT